MNRSTILLGTAIIVTACFACTPAPTPSSTPIGGATVQSRLVATCDSSNPSQFLSRLYMLTNYDPDPNHPGKSLPSGTQPVDDPYCTSLTNAYNFSAPSLKNALDNLTATFIDTHSCVGASAACSWGFKDKYKRDGTDLCRIVIQFVERWSSRSVFAIRVLYCVRTAAGCALARIIDTGQFRHTGAGADRRSSS